MSKQKDSLIRLTDQNGAKRDFVTNAFGYYRFAEVALGETYIVSVLAKRYSFAPRIISVSEDLDDLNFIAK